VVLKQSRATSSLPQSASALASNRPATRRFVWMPAYGCSGVSSMDPRSTQDPLPDSSSTAPRPFAHRTSRPQGRPRHAPAPAMSRCASRACSGQLARARARRLALDFVLSIATYVSTARADLFFFPPRAIDFQRRRSPLLSRRRTRLPVRAHHRRPLLLLPLGLLGVASPPPARRTESLPAIGGRSGRPGRATLSASDAAVPSPAKAGHHPSKVSGSPCHLPQRGPVAAGREFRPLTRAVRPQG
jgi:hypothetical protein